MSASGRACRSSSPRRNCRSSWRIASNGRPGRRATVSSPRSARHRRDIPRSRAPPRPSWHPPARPILSAVRTATIPNAASVTPRRQARTGSDRLGRPGSLPTQQPFDIVELELRALRIGEAPPQLLQHPCRALHVGLAAAGHLDRAIGVAPRSRGPAERIMVLAIGLSAAGTLTAGRRALSLPLPLLRLLHLLGEALGSAPERFQRPTLRANGVLAPTAPELALGVAHGLLRP